VKSRAGQGALLGLRRAVIPIAIGVLCLVISFWAIDDLVGLLRGIGWICLAVALLLVGVNAWNARQNHENLDFKHHGFEDREHPSS
jgi:hypothetical protein